MELLHVLNVNTSDSQCHLVNLPLNIASDIIYLFLIQICLINDYYKSMIWLSNIDEKKEKQDRKKEVYNEWTHLLFEEHLFTICGHLCILSYICVNCLCIVFMHSIPLQFGYSIQVNITPLLLIQKLNSESFKPSKWRFLAKKKEKKENNHPLAYAVYHQQYTPQKHVYSIIEWILRNTLVEITSQIVFQKQLSSTRIVIYYE